MMVNHSCNPSNHPVVTLTTIFCSVDSYVYLLLILRPAELNEEGIRVRLGQKGVVRLEPNKDQKLFLSLQKVQLPPLYFFLS